MFSRRTLLLIWMCACAAALFLPVTNADDWQPINPDELKMTSLPEAPEAAAVFLYRQVDRDDTANREVNYLRIKILKEEGRKYADIEIPFLRGNSDVSSVKARTIRPDGTISNFQGKPVEKMIVKAKGIKYLAKVLVLPDVQVGSIIEYRYTTEFKENFVFDSHWILSGELFTRRAKFSLKPYGYIPVRWTWQSLPAGTNPPKNEQNMVRLESSNIPAFQTEDYMPPENELKSRVDFIYSENDETQSEKFWKKEAKKQHDRVESFVGKRKAMEQAVAQIVAPGDTPEVKLRKIYARVQQLRNTSYEEEVTEQEKKRAKEKTINNVEDMWKNGYGSGSEITWLFLALARAVGLEAYPMLVAGRNEYLFHPNSMDPHRLDDNVVMVKLNGNSFYDPGAKFTPFGMLPWQETAVVGLKLDKDGGEWITTSIPDGTVSNIQRKADLKLTDQGSLEGKLTVTFSGLEALSVRLTQRNSDAAERKKFLEDEVREFIPVGVDVDLTNTPEWNSSAPTLVAEYDLKVQGWAAQAGRRALIPVGLFGAPEKHVFEHAARVHPIYFSFPTARIDDVTIELPLDWKVSSVPPERKDPGKVCAFSTSVENKNGTLHLTRNLDIETLELDTKYYPALRNFFQTVRTGDDQQIVVQPGAAAAAN
jgi:transglutaminase-like putative cysteine protease